MTTNPTPAGHGDRPRCGADRGDQPPCTQHAGWGTPHPGIGRCKLHGGSTPTHVASAERELRDRQISAARQRFGIPVDVSADIALGEELARTNGMVTYLQALVSGLDQEQLKQRDLSGKFERPAVWVEMLGQERDRLRVTAKTMIDVGFAERQVTLAEQQGQLLAAGLGWFLGRLGLAGDERARALVGEMLGHLAAGRVPELEQGGA